VGFKTTFSLLPNIWGIVDMGDSFCSERTSPSVEITDGLRHYSHSRIRSLWYSWPHVFCLIFLTRPTWRARFPFLYPPGTEWSSFTPQVLYSPFAASYDSQEYNGNIWICLPRGSCSIVFLRYNSRKISTSDSSLNDAHWTVAAETCLPRRSLSMAVPCDLQP
jgi:hypothetical protein